MRGARGLSLLVEGLIDEKLRMFDDCNRMKLVTEDAGGDRGVLLGVLLN